MGVGSEREVGLGGGGCQGGWERRIEAFVKIQKKKFFFWGGCGGRRGDGLGVRVDVNREVKFFKKKKIDQGGGGEGIGWGSGCPIRGWGWGGGGSKNWGRWGMG